MFKLIRKTTALLVLTLLATTMATAQTVNMSKYITLTVTQGEQISLDLMAAAAGTPVKIVSGSTNTVVTVGTSWTNFRNYTAGSTTMTIYGDITAFDCSNNSAKLTALDVSQNTVLTKLICRYNQLTSLDVSQNTALELLQCEGNQLTALDVSQNTALTELKCYSNNFTTRAFNDLMCSLPPRAFADNAKFYPLNNASDAKYADFMAADSQIAKNKNWQVRYGVSGNIPATSGTYTCPTVNMSRYITLTVTQGQQIKLDLMAAAANTPVKIVSGSTDTVVTEGTSWIGSQYYTAGAGTMTVYGDITGFNCSGNGAKLTALDVTQNTALTLLDCSGNQLTALDVTQNTALRRLYCGGNYQLTSLDVSQNTALTGLYCSSNQLTSLDVSQNTALTTLYCNGNQLTSLDVSQNTALTLLWCWGNSFTVQAFNALMCSLPARTAADDAGFYPLYNASDAKYADFMATNSQIAKDKNWQVRYWQGNEDEIPATNGTYTCPTANMNKYITLTVQQGEQISLDLKAAAAGTPVKIVSGSTEQTITVGTSWIDFQNYTAGATTMTVYGDITGFDCSENGAKLTALDASQNTALTELYCSYNQLTSLDVSRNTALTGLYCSGNQLTSLDVSQNTALVGLICRNNQLTALDVSQNTALKTLVCYGNSFTVQAFNDIMCSLPARTADDDAKFYPLYNASDAKYADFMAANSQIATAKNWQVRYGESGEIPATTGTYVCGGGSGSVNMNKYITLTVQQGEQISLDLKAAAAGTPVKIVSGSTETVVTVGTGWTNFQNYTAGAGTMTVYGDITGFDCSDNEAYLTALDASQNTALTELYCYGNSFTTQAFNDLMCSLPARTAADNAKFFPLLNASDAKYADFMAANSQIATAKNWQVLYYEGGDIPATTGTYTCPVIGIAEVASVPLAVYPNPATDILTIETEATGSAITLTDLTGRTVLTSTATEGKTTLNVSELSAGTYIVRVGNRVGKIVKR